jgi:predicted ATPase/class 3 adenylate cyclase
MGKLPTGTITMLFSDIEGSTKLLSRLGDQYGEALSAQRAMLRGAISACHGHEMGTEGDSFFVVFGSAADAVRCCVTAQQALYRYHWPGGTAVRVRMGLHSGEPIRHEDGYIGLDVHRAARIAAAAHGGQVVLSDATRLLVESRLPAGVSVRDLGLHRLKDIDAPEHVYQLATDGLPDLFPPLKSLGAPTSLPVPLTAMVGREDDLARLHTSLAGPETRLVTLTGPGGVGKTRLALAAAAALHETFLDGVYFVPLAAVRDADVMWKVIADSLDASGDGPIADVVTGHVRDRRSLLVLDNLEQLAGAADVVATLLGATPQLVVLATSRRPLHLPGERELAVPPLPVPHGTGTVEVAACDAVRLFVRQADLVSPGFAVTPANAADIAAICQRLDGLPLAIELAASRIKLLPPRALLARLGDGPGLPAPDAGRPERQQTVRATIAWSYDLLTPELARAFRAMAVFTGGCDLAALAAVAAPVDGTAAGCDPLQLAAGLLDVSLVTVTEGVAGEPRVIMLETIREYALARLDQAGGLDLARRRHAEYFAALAERAQEQLNGPAQLVTLDQLEAEHRNLLTALNWSLAPAPADAGGGRTALGLRLVQALAPFWYQHGHATEGRRWLQQAIALTADDTGAPLARMAHWLGMLLFQQDELTAALALFERSLAIWRDLGEEAEQVRELNSLGGTYRHLGDLDTARALLTDSAAIARRVGNQGGLGVALANLGQVESAAGNRDRAAELLREALALQQERGDLMRVAIIQQTLAVDSLFAGRAGEARELLAASLDYVIGSGDTEFLIDALELAAAIAAQMGDCGQAARLAGAAAAIRQEAGMPASEPDAATLEHFLAPARAAVAPADWEAGLAWGRALTQPQAITLLTQPLATQAGVIPAS